MKSEHERVVQNGDSQIDISEQARLSVEVQPTPVTENQIEEKESFNEADKVQIESVVKKSRNKGLLILAFPVIAAFSTVGHDLYSEGSNNPKLAKIANEIRMLLDVAKEGGVGLGEHSLANDVSEAVGPLALQKILRSGGPSSEVDREKIRAEMQLASVELGGDVNKYLHEEDVRDITGKCIPRSFGVGKISFVDSSKIDNNALALAGGNEAIACVRDGSRDIELFPNARRCNPALLLKVLLHEASHCADAENSMLMTTAEKVKLEHMLIGRIHAPNRYKSDYVESIGIASDASEAKEVAHIKSTEYFAEIMSSYLCEPAMLSQEDRSIVEFVIKKLDPQFGVKSANASFRRILRTVNSRVALSQNDEAPNYNYTFDSHHAAVVFNKNGAVRFFSEEGSVAKLD